MSDLDKKITASIIPVIQPMDDYVKSVKEAEEWCDGDGVWFSIKNEYWHVSISEASIEQIKQAIIDDGWIHISASQETQAAIANTMLGNPVMTGQEWYDKFFKELGELDGEIAYTTKIGGFYSDVYGVWGKSIEEAAKKASGLK